MAGLRELLQRLAHDLEQAGAQQPGDDLRARLGYGSGDEVDDADGGDTSETDTVREPETVRKPSVTREPAASRTQASARAASGVSGAAYRAPTPSPAASPHTRPSSEFLLSERIRTRLRTPDALREAFVMKVLLDRPPGAARRGG